MTIHLAVSIASAGLVSALAWTVPPRLPRRWLVIPTVVGAALTIAGALFGWPLYPFTDLIIVAFAVCAGVLLGRVYPRPLWSFFLLLLVLGVLDVLQNLGTSAGPASTASAAPDPHLSWLNFRIPLPSGHFNIGFADLLLIAAMVEHLRRHGAGFAIVLIPGVAGLGAAELALVVIKSHGAIAQALRSSLIPYLALGWILAVAALHMVAATSPPPGPQTRD